MKKRIFSLLLALVMVLGLLPTANAFGRGPIPSESVPTKSVDQCCYTLRKDAADHDYTVNAFDGYLLEITPYRVEEIFWYLNEFYIERYPEAALVVNTGDHRDQEMIKTLAETITEGCTTDTEKANAIDRWLDYNIDYVMFASSFASDVLLDRIADCEGYAFLMQFLLRSLGIPAVMGDGWRADMKKETVELFDYIGHAWCYVYLEGEWALYDPLWMDGGTTDRDYIAENFYCSDVEMIFPIMDPEHPSPFPGPWEVFYSDGALFSNANNYSVNYNTQYYEFTTSQNHPEYGTTDDWHYLDDVSDKSQMRYGDVYHNSWISRGNYRTGENFQLTYAHANGMQIDGAVMEYDGHKLLMYGGQSFRILADENDYTITYGDMTFRPGYVGPFLDGSWGNAYRTDEYYTEWVSYNPSVVTFDENGIMTAVATGSAAIRITLWQKCTIMDIPALKQITFTDLVVNVSDRIRVPDYSDHSVCKHNYILVEKTDATCTYTGIAAYTCSHCDDSYTEELPIDPNAHIWHEYECSLCSAIRQTLFDDVVPGQFYEEPVAWAVENGITSGMSATTFAPNATCTRAQVVTFLWRAMGQPAPGQQDNPFSDVKQGDYFYDAVLWAVENGITAGTSATTFVPNNPCTRDQVVTFLWRAMGKPTPEKTDNPFTDVASGIYYYEPVLWAVENGITSGTSATTFAPSNPCTRGQVVTFLYRAFSEQ